MATSTIIIILVVVAILVGAIMLIVTGIRKSRAKMWIPLQNGWLNTASAERPPHLRKLNFPHHFTNVSCLPIIRRLGEISSRFTPQHVVEQTRLKLELAGNPGRMDASTFMMLHFISAGIVWWPRIPHLPVLSNIYPPHQAFDRSGFYRPWLFLPGFVDPQQD